MRSKRLVTTGSVVASAAALVTVLAACTGPSGEVRAGVPTPRTTSSADAGGAAPTDPATGAPQSGAPGTPDEPGAAGPSGQSPGQPPSGRSLSAHGPSAHTQTPDASSLPPGLQSAITRDLDITPQQYLAGAQAAAAAPATIARLARSGIDPTQAWLDGAVLKVHATGTQQQEAARAVGAEPTSASPPTVPALRTTTPYEDLVDGTGWYLPVNSSSIAICSTGFNGWNAAGAKTVATAGHCLLGNSPVPAAPVTATRYVQTQPNQAGTAGSTIGNLEYNSFQFGNGYDSGLIDVSNSALVPKPQVSTWDGNTVAVRGMITATVGAYICKSGRTTGWTCGTVQRVNYAQGISSGQTVNSIQTSMCMYHGDSGGPAMIGFYAVGVNSSGTWSSTACTDSGGYSAIYPIQGDADSIVAQQAGWEPMVTVDAPTVTGVTPGSTTVMNGTLSNAATGDSVSVYLDGASTPAASAAVDTTSGTWSVSLPSQTPTVHTYQVIAGWGAHSRSTPATGSYLVAVTCGPLPGQNDRCGGPEQTPAPTSTPEPTSTPAALSGPAALSALRVSSRSLPLV